MNKLTRIIFTLYIIINALFVWKYIQRIYEFPIIVVAVYVLLAIVGIAAIREKIRYSHVPKSLQGTGIAFIVTGLMGIAFMSFLGITFK